jgi:hypothetical protein
MFSAVRRHVVSRLASAPLRAQPFPHVYVEDVFPQDFYDDMIARLPRDESYTRLVDTGRVTKAYSPERLCFFGTQSDPAAPDDAGSTFWTGLLQALVHDDLTHAMLAKFQASIKDRFASAGAGRGMQLQCRSETFLMRDLTNYELGPHTDTPSKLISALFYLAQDDTAPHLGTALYAPKQPGFTCEDGGHHDFHMFDRVTTMPYRRNALVAFPKTPACFHGVEPVTGPSTRRDLLLFNVKGKATAA